MTKRYKNRIYHSLNDIEWIGEEQRHKYSEPHKRFYRNKIDGVLGGVCAGIGDYIELDPLIVRGLFVLLILFTGLPVFVYFMLWIFIPSDKRASYHKEYCEAREVRRAARRSKKFRCKAREGEPVFKQSTSFREVKSKYSSLEVRVQDMERSLTSKEWQLRRQFRELEE